MYDQLIRNALVYDGTGCEPVRTNVAVFDDVFAFIGKGNIVRARRIIDADGLVMTPGFIDIHTHSELEVMRDRRAMMRIGQGITTDVSGNCGIGCFPATEALRKASEDVLGHYPEWSWTDFRSFSSCMLSSGIAINEALLVPHSALRFAAMGDDAGRIASDAEIDRMCGILSSELEAGAAGFSSGLYYNPCVFSDSRELKALLSVVKAHGRIFSVHHRCEGNDVIASLREVLDAAEETGVRIEVSHLKAIGKANQPKVAQMLDMIDAYRGRGVDVGFDQYPYTFGSTSLYSLLPPDILSLSRLEQRLALSLDNEREDIKKEMLNPSGWDSIYEMVGPDDIRVLYLEGMDEYTGKSLSEIGGMKGKDPLDALFDLLSEETGLAVMTDVTESDDNLVRIMSHPLMSFGSDALYSSPIKHPRSTEAVKEFLLEYVEKRHVMTFQEGIRRLTGKNADRMGFNDRGYVKEGYKADWLLFRKEDLKMRYISVNGSLVLDDGIWNDIRPGRIISSFVK